MEKKRRVSKKEVGWAEKAPLPCCKSCVHMQREGQYGEKFRCGKHGFMTKGMAICDDYQGSYSA